MRLLNISRNTLHNYVKRGLIKVTKIPNSYYNYDKQMVYNFLEIKPRMNIIYSRISTYKQKGDLERQMKKKCKPELPFMPVSLGSPIISQYVASYSFLRQSFCKHILHLHWDYTHI